MLNQASRSVGHLSVHGKQVPFCFLCVCIFKHSRVPSTPYKGAGQKLSLLCFLSGAKCSGANHFICPLQRLYICIFFECFLPPLNNWRQEGHMLPVYEAIPWKSNSRPGLFSLFRQHLAKPWPWLKLQGWVNHIYDYRFLKGTCF